MGDGGGYLFTEKMGLGIRWKNIDMYCRWRQTEEKKKNTKVTDISFVLCCEEATWVTAHSGSCIWLERAGIMLLLRQVRYIKSM